MLDDDLRQELEAEKQDRVFGLVLRLLSDDEIESGLAASRKKGTREEPNLDFDEADLEEDEVAVLEKVEALRGLGEEELVRRIAAGEARG